MGGGVRPPDVGRSGGRPRGGRPRGPGDGRVLLRSSRCRARDQGACFPAPRGGGERGRGQIVKSTGDGVFAAFETAQAGIDGASAIQRALRDHRASTGLGLAVRIGLHAAEATRRGVDYSGIGVHVAARIGALAGSGEILASAMTLAEAADVPSSAPRVVSVRGVTTAVTVAAILWE